MASQAWDLYCVSNSLKYDGYVAQQCGKGSAGLKKDAASSLFDQALSQLEKLEKILPELKKTVPVVSFFISAAQEAKLFEDGGKPLENLRVTTLTPWGTTGSKPIPAITSSLSVSGTQGVVFSYQITATNSPTSFGASGLPAGLSVNTTTGLIAGTPTVSGTLSVALSATNSGGTGTATLSLTINPSPEEPPVSGGTTYHGTFSGSADDADNFPGSVCNWRHSVEGEIFATVKGNGTLIDPYTGTFRVKGKVTTTKLAGSTNCPEETSQFDLSTPISGSSGKVEAHGTAAAYEASYDFTEGTFSGNTLSGTFKINSAWFVAPIVQIVNLAKQ
ncbi:MAG: putative Ig domain-containing protein [Acidobacteria bacterium]|nr:putative Ig domain-containing protein [Acidobacteriota bacterium]